MSQYADLLASRDVGFDIADLSGQHLTESDLLPIVHRYDGIVAGDDELSAAVMSAAERLKVISKWGIGTDSIDKDAARLHGIEVYNTPDVFGEELADYALGYLLMLARKQHTVDKLVRQGEWPKLRGESLAGKTIGIVGLGSSGRCLARRVVAMGMAALGHDLVLPDDQFFEQTGCTAVTFDELIASVDVISLHLPLTDTTRGLLGEDAFARMRMGTWLINTSRGPIIDEPALCAALETGRVGAAALDVFEREPLEPDNLLRQLPNVILGSHNASNTFQAVDRTNRLAINNLLKGLEKSR